MESMDIVMHVINEKSISDCGVSVIAWLCEKADLKSTYSISSSFGSKFSLSIIYPSEVNKTAPAQSFSSFSLSINEVFSMFKIIVQQ